MDVLLLKLNVKISQILQTIILYFRQKPNEQFEYRRQAFLILYDVAEALERKERKLFKNYNNFLGYNIQT